jgi:hypothetical protein
MPASVARSRTSALLVSLIVLAALAATGASPASATSRRFSTNTGTSTAGYKWQNQGPDAGRAATNFGAGMKWKLNVGTTGVVNAESYVSGALSSVNAAGSGISQVWGGTTATTSVPTCGGCGTYENAWLVRMLPTTSFNSVCASTAMGCAKSYTVSSDGGLTFNVTSCIVYVNSDKYKSGSWSGAVWGGVFRHEIAHCLGLEHYEATYGGVYQLMRSVAGGSGYQAGDINGIRAVTRRV